MDKYIDGDSKKEIECKLKLKKIADKIHVQADINIPHYDDHLNKALWEIMPETLKDYKIV